MSSQKMWAVIISHDKCHSKWPEPPWPSHISPGFSSKCASEGDWIHLEKWFAGTVRDAAEQRWGCFPWSGLPWLFEWPNSRNSSTSARKKKTLNTTFTLFPDPVPKGSLDDTGKGGRVQTWPWLALQALMCLKVHRPKKDSEGKWGMMIHESNKFHPAGSMGKSPGHRLRLVGTSEAETMKSQTCRQKEKTMFGGEGEAVGGEWIELEGCPRHRGGSPSSDLPGPLSRGLWTEEATYLGVIWGL